MVYMILRDMGIPFQSAQSWVIYQTGIRLIFSNQSVDILGLLAQICGKATELEDLSKRPGKSSFF